MSIDERFRELRRRGEGALIGYVTGGDPSLKISQQIVETIAQVGADIIEIGVPFSDPIADGPTIQAASNRSLNAGTTPKKIFDIVKETKKRIEIPIALMRFLKEGK
jgi:tryptophan synthase alpha chain